MPGTICYILTYTVSFKPHSNAVGGVGIGFHLTERETSRSEVRWLAQAPGYWVGGTGVRSRPQSSFKIEKVKSVKGNSPLHMESEGQKDYMPCSTYLVNKRSWNIIKISTSHTAFLFPSDPTVILCDCTPLRRAPQPSNWRHRELHQWSWGYFVHYRKCSTTPGLCLLDARRTPQAVITNISPDVAKCLCETNHPL